jgi:DNA invertase Pin-like site-specific DNA recombinase
MSIHNRSCDVQRIVRAHGRSRSGGTATLLVWRLDRLGQSLRHLIDLVEDLRQRGVGFKSICDGAIDTTTASGELIFNVFANLAQFERRLIQERTKAGLRAACIGQSGSFRLASAPRCG